jgi:hypothetical protein
MIYKSIYKIIEKYQIYLFLEEEKYKDYKLELNKKLE